MESKNTQSLSLIYRLMRSYYGDATFKRKIILTLGGLSLLSLLYKFVRTFYYLTRDLLPKRNLIQRYGKGSYAVVTGATSGIGKSVAIRFGELGFNVVLISRTEEKLKETREEILAQLPDIDVRYISADLSNISNEQVYEHIKKELEGLDVSILVNNVGLDCLDKFRDLKEDYILRLVNVNVHACTMMMRMMLNTFSTRTKRCAVINVGSFTSEVPMTYYAVYGATKAFVKYLTLALVREDPNVDYLCIKPSEVSTAMTHFKKEDIMTISPR